MVAVAHTLADPLLVQVEVGWWPTGIRPTVIGVPGCGPLRLDQHQPIGKCHHMTDEAVPGVEDAPLAQLALGGAGAG